jgi:hypothetical protein
MKTKLLPASTGIYRVIRSAELSEEQRNVLKVAGRERALERICALLGEGRVSLSVVQKRYGALMRECGRG